MRRTTSYPKVSNRERQRLAQQAIRQAMDMRMILLAVLGQRGGEVTITEGTLAQITSDLDFEVVVSPTHEKERIVRIIK